MNAFGYQHARDVSIGNTAFMQALVRQLHATPEDTLEIAESLVGAKLACTLGGDYELAADGRGAWLSTAWSGENRHALAAVPEDYVFPVLQWFRGASGEMLAARLDLGQLFRGELGGHRVRPALRPAA